MSPHNRLWAVSIALCAGAAITAVGCIKEKDSLVLVNLTAEMTIPGPIQVRITVGPVSQTFDLAGGLNATTPTERGVYLDSKTTGAQVVNATTQGGTPCLTYAAMPQQTVVIGSAGETQMASLTLVHSGTCTGNGDGGSGGTNGTGGTSNTDAGNDRPGSGGGVGTDAGPGTGGKLGTGGGPGSGGSPGLGGNGAGGTGAGGNGAGGAVTTAPPSLAPSTCHEFLHANGSDCTLAANEVTIYTVSVSPNGTLVASAGSDGRVKIWRFDGHTLTAEGHVLVGSGFAVAAFSPDGTMLAAGFSSGIDLYSTTTWLRLRTLTTAAQVYDLAFTPDSQQVMSIDFSTLYAHAIGTPAPLHTQAIPEDTWAMAVSPAPTTTPVVAVATDDQTVKVFTHSAAGFASAGPTLTVSTLGTKALTVKFSPDGKLLAASGDDGLGTIHIWNYPLASATATTPDIDVFTPVNSDELDMVEFHPSGKYIAAGGAFIPSASIFNVTAPRAILSAYTNPTANLLSVAFSPNGKALLGGEDDCGLVLVCAD